MCGIPSKCTHGNWILAFSPNYEDEELTDMHARLIAKKKLAKKQNLKSGKWLVYVDRSDVDKVWKKIKKATEEGSLGIEAKVANKIQSDLFGGGKSHVICVYTHDWTDVKDVMRVREKLKDLGIINKISYKSDEDTIAGKYARKGDKVSKYYE